LADSDVYHSLLKEMTAKLTNHVAKSVVLLQSYNNGIGMIQDIKKYLVRGEQSKKNKPPISN